MLIDQFLPDFDFNDDALDIGVRVMTALALSQEA